DGGIEEGGMADFLHGGSLGGGLALVVQGLRPRHHGRHQLGMVQQVGLHLPVIDRHQTVLCQGQYGRQAESGAADRARHSDHPGAHSWSFICAVVAPRMSLACCQSALPWGSLPRARVANTSAFLQSPALYQSSAVARFAIGSLLSML